MRVLVISGSRAQLPDPVYPLGAAIVGTVARKAGHDVSCFDALRHEDPADALSEKISSFAPDVFLLSVRNIDSSAFPNPELFFEDYRPLIDVCRRETNVPIVLGGSGFSLMPKAFMKYLRADCGVVGEGEKEIVSLLDIIAKGQTCPEIIRAERGIGPYFLPERDLFDANWYYQSGGVTNIQTKRGCPKNCIYCTYPLLEGCKTRNADPTQVVDEMASLVRSGIRHFFFVDAVFNKPESHAAAICEEIVRRELDVSFAAYFVPEGDLKEFPALLKRAGCEAAELGTDALSDPMLDSYKKGFTVEKATDFSRRIAKVGIPQCHNLVLGGPGETAQTMAESVARMDRIDPRAVIVTVGLRVYPGTELERIALKDEDSTTVLKDRLEPVFFIDEAVAKTIVETAAEWVDERRGWICPGLGKRYNIRYLTRQRQKRGRKGVLWTLF